MTETLTQQLPSSEVKKPEKGNPLPSIVEVMADLQEKIMSGTLTLEGEYFLRIVADNFRETDEKSPQSPAQEKPTVSEPEPSKVNRLARFAQGFATFVENHLQSPAETNQENANKQDTQEAQTSPEYMLTRLNELRGVQRQLTRANHAVRNAIKIMFTIAPYTEADFQRDMVGNFEEQFANGEVAPVPPVDTSVADAQLAADIEEALRPQAPKADKLAAWLKKKEDEVIYNLDSTLEGPRQSTQAKIKQNIQEGVGKVLSTIDSVRTNVAPTVEKTKTAYSKTRTAVGQAVDRVKNDVLYSTPSSRFLTTPEPLTTNNPDTTPSLFVKRDSEAGKQDNRYINFDSSQGLTVEQVVAHIKNQGIQEEFLPNVVADIIKFNMPVVSAETAANTWMKQRQLIDQTMKHFTSEVDSSRKELDPIINDIVTDIVTKFSTQYHNYKGANFPVIDVFQKEMKGINFKPYSSEQALEVVQNRTRDLLKSNYDLVKNQHPFVQQTVTYILNKRPDVNTLVQIEGLLEKSWPADMPRHLFPMVSSEVWAQVSENIATVKANLAKQHELNKVANIKNAQSDLVQTVLLPSEPVKPAIESPPKKESWIKRLFGKSEEPRDMAA